MGLLGGARDLRCARVRVIMDYNTALEVRAVKVVAISALAVACACSSYTPKPPAPPIPALLPDDLEGSLPRTDGGLPILLANPLGAGTGVALALTFDKTLDDPVTRWGECMGRVVACYDANGANAIEGCLRLIETCPTDRGGNGCCPRTCLTAYENLRAQGQQEDRAVIGSYLRGDCIRDLAAARDTTPVTP
jgi:hypothetical protein